MNCDDVMHMLSDHHHETLAEGDAVAVAEHLGSCGACAQAYCRVQAQLRGIAVAYAERPSAAAKDALRARVKHEFSPAPARRVLAFLRRPVPAYGAALAAAIPLVAWMAARTPEHDVSPAVADHPPAPARIHDYDATVPLFDRSVS